MKRINFKDGRGDEYTIALYNTNDVKVRKKKAHSPGFHEIEFSDEAIERLQDFLDED